MRDKLKVVFVDLDGTLLNSQKRISKRNLETLNELKRRDIVRVAVTGRSLYSFHSLHLPVIAFDYLVVSTGAAIIDLKTKVVLFTSSHNNEDVITISECLMEEEVDFMVHEQAPENHPFVYFQCNRDNSDFNTRVRLYKKFASNVKDGVDFPSPSSQIIGILPHNLMRLKGISRRLKKFEIIRTTSPLDGKSLWIEIFPENISKGYSADWLCRYLNVDRVNTFSVGNDFNDLSLLEFTRYSYVVENGAGELLKKFTATKSNDDDGFSHAVEALWS